MKGRYRYINKKNRDNEFHSYTIQSEVLKSGYTVLQTKKALSKAWLGYTIAKNKAGEHERMIYYASVIQKLQRELLDASIIDQQSLAKFPYLDIDEAVTNQKTN
ncbi:MAG: hypothetical protein WA364_26230 [Candidatus Nitrosopolaris sp.]